MFTNSRKCLFAGNPQHSPSWKNLSVTCGPTSLRKSCRFTSEKSRADQVNKPATTACGHRRRAIRKIDARRRGVQLGFASAALLADTLGRVGPIRFVHFTAQWLATDRLDLGTPNQQAAISHAARYRRALSKWPGPADGRARIERPTDGLRYFRLCSENVIQSPLGSVFCSGPRVPL